MTIPSSGYAVLVYEAELAVLQQQHDGLGRKVLGDRADLPSRLGCRGRIQLQVREPITCLLDHLAIPHHRERQAGDLVLVDERRGVGVDFVGLCRPG
jgi:hypothetical protein